MAENYPSQYAAIPLGDLENMNTDRDVFPVIMTRGLLVKTVAGDWEAQAPIAKEDTVKTTWAKRISSVGNITYIAKAPIGTATSAASWQAKRLSGSGGAITDITWADGDEEFDNIADNLNSLTYS